MAAWTVLARLRIQTSTNVFHLYLCELLSSMNELKKIALEIGVEIHAGWAQCTSPSKALLVVSATTVRVQTGCVCGRR